MRIVWLTGTGVFLLASLFVGWFSHFDMTDVYTSHHLGPAMEIYCSDFAHDDIQCRVRGPARGVDWELVPVFTFVRVVTLFAIVGAVLLLGFVVVRRPAWDERVLSHVGAGLILLFAVFIAGVPGDRRYEDYGLSWGALIGLAAALSLFLGALPRRRLDASLAAGVVSVAFVLGAALWIPWLGTPNGGPEDSSYSFGTLNRVHHWRGVRSPRRHYLGDRIRRLEARKIGKHLPYFAGLGTAASGMILAGVVLTALRRRAFGFGEGDRERHRRRLLISAGVYFGLSLIFVLLFVLLERHVRYVGFCKFEWGLLLATLGTAGAGWLALVPFSRGSEKPGTGVLQAPDFTGLFF